MLRVSKQRHLATRKVKTSDWISYKEGYRGFTRLHICLGIASILTVEFGETAGVTEICCSGRAKLTMSEKDGIATAIHV